MKITPTLLLAAVMVTGSLQARTWTSAEGGKTFKGEYISHTDEFVTVYRGFKKVRFKLSLLSEADRVWLREKKQAGEEKVPEVVAAGKIAEKLTGNMVKLTGDKYEDYVAVTQPEYYIIYFTASW